MRSPSGCTSTGPDLSYLFTFGTPVADGTTAQFRKPWGMAFWPDATGNGGRPFINGQ